jgi:hypothetical protein
VSLGKQYEKLCNLQAIELLEPYYKNPSVIEKIKLNLTLLKEKFNLSSLNLKINRLSKVINNESKKYI